MRRLLAAFAAATAASAEISPSQFSRPFADLRAAYLDLETTGPDPRCAHIVQAAVVLSGGGAPDQAHEWLVNPGVPIPPGATAVHRISTDMVRRQPLFMEVAADLLGVLDRADLVVAYNGLHFDMPILQRELGDAGLSYDPPVLDPFVWASWYRRASPLTLGGLAGQMGVHLPPEEAHGALGDARALSRLTPRLVDAGDIPDWRAIAVAQSVIAEFVRIERDLLGGLIYLDRRTAAVHCGGKKHLGAPLRDVDLGFIDWCLRLDDLPALAREILSNMKRERQQR